VIDGDHPPSPFCAKAATKARQTDGHQSGALAMPSSRSGRCLAASPKSGINSITGDGLKEAMVGAQVVIDLAALI
jgi:hypothetical protein